MAAAKATARAELSHFSHVEMNSIGTLSFTAMPSSVGRSMPRAESWIVNFPLTLRLFRRQDAAGEGYEQDNTAK
jgi:hypothetical protein